MFLGIVIGSVLLLAVIILVLCRRVAPPDVAYIVLGLREQGDSYSKANTRITQ